MRPDLVLFGSREAIDQAIASGATAAAQQGHNGPHRAVDMFQAPADLLLASTTGSLSGI